MAWLAAFLAMLIREIGAALIGGAVDLSKDSRRHAPKQNKRREILRAKVREAAKRRREAAR